MASQPVFRLTAEARGHCSRDGQVSVENDSNIEPAGHIPEELRRKLIGIDSISNAFDSRPRSSM
jgi:hypothetical protein